MSHARPALLLVFVVAACGGEDDNSFTTECGTFDPDDLNGSDGVFPQDPMAPGLVAACEDYCEAMATGAGCTTGMTECVDECRLATCDVCPGKLQPLVECQTAETDAMACTCGPNGPECAVPAACAEEMGQLGACGG